MQFGDVHTATRRGHKGELVEQLHRGIEKTRPFSIYKYLEGKFLRTIKVNDDGYIEQMPDGNAHLYSKPIITHKTYDNGQISRSKTEKLITSGKTDEYHQWVRIVTENGGMDSKKGSKEYRYILTSEEEIKKMYSVVKVNNKVIECKSIENGKSLEYMVNNEENWVRSEVKDGEKVENEVTKKDVEQIENIIKNAKARENEFKKRRAKFKMFTEKYVAPYFTVNLIPWGIYQQLINKKTTPEDRKNLIAIYKLALAERDSNVIE